MTLDISFLFFMILLLFEYNKSSVKKTYLARFLLQQKRKAKATPINTTATGMKMANIKVKSKTNRIMF